jgi:hypothetical protein
MVIQRTVESLRERPRDERKAVAGGIAIGIVAILFFGWAFLFFKDIQRDTQFSSFETIVPEEVTQLFE